MKRYLLRNWHVLIIIGFIIYIAGMVQVPSKYDLSYPFSKFRLLYLLPIFPVLYIFLLAPLILVNGELERNRYFGSLSALLIFSVECILVSYLYYYIFEFKQMAFYLAGTFVFIYAGALFWLRETSLKEFDERELLANTKYKEKEKAGNILYNLMIENAKLRDEISKLKDSSLSN